MRFSKLAIALSAEDVDASRTFWERHLGFTPVVELDWYVSLHHTDHDHYVVDLVSAGHESLPEQFRGRSVDGTSIALVVDDAAAEEARLHDAGVEVAEPLSDMPWGQRRFHVVAPEGTVVEMVQFIDPDPAWIAAMTN